MDKVILFIALSLPVIFFSKKNLFEPRRHGYTRFFGWECILVLFVINYGHWFKEPCAVNQIVSWVLLIISAWFVTEAAVRLSQARKRGIVRVDEKLFRFEKTTELVTSGIFRYIRHPMYSSLLLLVWGIWLKHPLAVTLPVALFASWLFWLTAKHDERECLEYFGSSYSDYMTRTKMLIPFVF
jgi:protein-S-isoprenylcysteine O-methyltransferase Ste14